MTLTDTEILFFHKLAELYPKQQGPCYFEVKHLEEELRLSPEEVQTLLRMAEEGGFICDVAKSGHTFLAFNVSVRAVEASRDILSQQKSIESRDRVAQLLTWMRSHPWRAGLVLIVLAIAFLVPIANQLLELLEKFGWFNPPAKQP